MEKYPMNRSGCRTSCRNNPYSTEPMRMTPRTSMPCSREQESIYTHIDHMPLAMAYVPCQKFSKTFDLCYALNMGTIFPDLCKPFCGKGGACR